MMGVDETRQCGFKTLESIFECYWYLGVDESQQCGLETLERIFECYWYFAIFIPRSMWFSSSLVFTLPPLNHGHPAVPQWWFKRMRSDQEGLQRFKDMGAAAITIFRYLLQRLGF